MKYAVCESCGLVSEAEATDMGLGWIGLYFHCGVSHDTHPDELFDTKISALAAAISAEAKRIAQ